jgi:hypothetical protein
MQTITQEGAFTGAVRDIINANFQELAGASGKTWYVSKTGGAGSSADGTSWGSAFASVQGAVNVAAAGDVIAIGPGSYDEAVTIDVSDVVLYGLGGAGAVAVAPSATNAVAITVSGSAASRTSGVTLINVGGEGNGTGGGLHVVGNIRRFRATGCKFEGGAYAVTLESTAAGSVGDTKLVGCELAWTTSALSLTASGGGDPVTQTLVQGCLFHNFTTDGIVNSVSHSADVWVIGNVFANQEDGTEPTQYLDLAVASTTGLVAGNMFATTVIAAAKLGIATGVMFVNNRTEAEQPGTNAFATSGRPD